MEKRVQGKWAENNNMGAILIKVVKDSLRR